MVVTGAGRTEGRFDDFDDEVGDDEEEVGGKRVDDEAGEGEDRAGDEHPFAGARVLHRLQEGRGRGRVKKR